MLHITCTCFVFFSPLHLCVTVVNFLTVICAIPQALLLPLSLLRSHLRFLFTSVGGIRTPLHTRTFLSKQIFYCAISAPAPHFFPPTPTATKNFHFKCWQPKQKLLPQKNIDKPDILERLQPHHHDHFSNLRAVHAFRQPIRDLCIRRHVLQ